MRIRMHDLVYQLSELSNVAASELDQGRTEGQMDPQVDLYKEGGIELSENSALSDLTNTSEPPHVKNSTTTTSGDQLAEEMSERIEMRHKIPAIKQECDNRDHLYTCHDNRFQDASPTAVSSAPPQLSSTTATETGSGNTSPLLGHDSDDMLNNSNTTTHAPATRHSLEDRPTGIELISAHAQMTDPRRFSTTMNLSSPQQNRQNSGQLQPPQLSVAAESFPPLGGWEHLSGLMQPSLTAANRKPHGDPAAAIWSPITQQAPSSVSRDLGFGQSAFAMQAGVAARRFTSPLFVPTAADAMMAHARYQFPLGAADAMAGYSTMGMGFPKDFERFGMPLSTTVTGGVMPKTEKLPSPSGSDDKHIWRKQEVEMLLDLYENEREKLVDPRMRKTRIWERIAHEISVKLQTDINACQCNQKFRNMKAEFYKVREFNSKSAQQKKTCKNFDRLVRILTPDSNGEQDTEIKLKNLEREYASRNELDINANPNTALPKTNAVASPHINGGGDVTTNDDVTAYESDSNSSGEHALYDSIEDLQPVPPASNRRGSNTGAGGDQAVGELAFPRAMKRALNRMKREVAAASKEDDLDSSGDEYSGGDGGGGGGGKRSRSDSYSQQDAGANVRAELFQVLSDFLGEQKRRDEEQFEKLETMHRERTTCIVKFLDIFKELIEKL